MFDRRMLTGALLLALGACGTAPGGNDTAGNGATSVGSGEAQAYLASFTDSDVDACFDDVALRDPALKAGAAAAGGPPARVVVLVDGSGSMAGRVGSRTKLELAREAAAAFIDGLPAQTSVSLLAFGHKGNNSEAGKAASCAAVETLVAPTQDRAALTRAAGGLRAVGWTPLAAGLNAAEASLTGEGVIYVVSDGEETCGGDPVAAAGRINAGAKRAIVNIVGFGLPTSEADALRKVASAGGGSFVNVTSDSAAKRTFDAVREANRQTVNAVRASAASTGNAVRTAAAQTRASVCTSGIIQRENSAVTRDLSARAAKGEPLAVADEVRALLRTRHDGIRTREREYRDGLSGANQAQQDAIDSALENAR